jgi:hypothetical protein
MPTHKGHSPEDNMPEHIPGGREPEEVDIRAGYETSDVRVNGILVFLTSMAVFVVVTALVCYGIGKVINAHLNQEDGPNSKWVKTVDIRQLGDMPSSPEMQNRVATLTQNFPTPRLQTDDGFEDIAELHQREDLLLDHYSWVDQSKGKVRIPIDRAMEILAQRGLPVAQAVNEPAPMTGDARPTVTAPLTDGFARTAYEQSLPASAEKNVNKEPSQ